MDKEYLSITMKWIAVVIGAIFIFGMIGVQYTRTVGKERADAEREVFKETTTYNEAMTTFLSDSYKQYNEAETDAEKSTIAKYVIMRYPNIDADSIDNDTLRHFYNQCLNH